MKIDNSVILMTALLPTTGHLDLIRFASLITKGTVTVIINGRDKEPIPTYWRRNALKKAAADLKNVYIFYDVDNDAPQNPNPNLEYDTEFWDYWADMIREAHPVYPDTVIIASEEYGGVLAEHMGIRFIPYDIGRNINPVKGSDVRADIMNNWNSILPEFRRHLTINVVMFGQESVGKTTIAKKLNRYFEDKSRFIPEYARGYLESTHIGPEVTDQKMFDIAAGQSAIQKMTMNDGRVPLNIFDTDLLSTIGYWEIFNKVKQDNPVDRGLVEDFQNMKDNLVYFLLPDDIPFEKDQLRYGGGTRESTYEFWKYLLDRNRCTYYEVPRGLNLRNKIDFCIMRIYNLIAEKYIPIRNFERE